MDIFEKTVMQTVEKNKKEACKQIQNEYKTMLETAVQTAEQAANERIFAERYKMELINNKRVAQALNHAKQTLAEIRNNYIDGLFNHVKDDVTAFVNTAAYKEYFQKKLGTHVNGFFTDVLVMERDKPLVPLELNLNIETTRDDFIGGFKLLTHDHRVVSDHTLLSAWNEQRDNFAALYNEALKEHNA